jgi:hypothetical protein
LTSSTAAILKNQVATVQVDQQHSWYVKKTATIHHHMFPPPPDCFLHNFTRRVKKFREIFHGGIENFFKELPIRGAGYTVCTPVHITNLEVLKFQ